MYLFDKNKVRIGEDVVALNNVGTGETVKFETTVTTSGNPASVSLEAILDSAKTISLTVNSTPQGALLKVDGVEAGTTPRMINVGVGRHTLAFSKEGFAVGTFPLEISRDDVSGGTVSFELGAAAFDSIELRDGSVLNGDLVSISGMDVEIRVGGVIQHVDRNRIKRVMLVERQVPILDVPPAIGPAPNTSRSICSTSRGTQAGRSCPPRSSCCRRTRRTRRAVPTLSSSSTGPSRMAPISP